MQNYNYNSGGLKISMDDMLKTEQLKKDKAERKKKEAEKKKKEAEKNKPKTFTMPSGMKGTVE